MARVWDAMNKHQAEPPAPAPNGGAHGADTPVQKALSTATATAPAAAPVLTGQTDGTRYSELLIAHHDRASGQAEEYRALRNSLLAHRPEGRFGVMITSAEAGEGKTVTCLNLAMALTERVDRRTLIIDADLRRSRVAKLLDAPGEPGLAELLRGELDARAVIQATAHKNLDLMAAGHIRHDEVGTLLGQPQVQDVMQDLRRMYDYILIDTPPINAVSDAGTLGQAVGEALMVVRMNKTHRESVDKAIRMLHASNVKIAGLVLTHRTYHIPDYIYRYS